jgi:sugar O-acyltransferase (sialic acid O-acetyltransferase NeuD family)
MKATKVVLVGGFGELFELCARCGIEVVGVFDESPAAVDGYDIPYLGTDELALAEPGLFRQVPIVVVPDAPTIRRRIVERYRSAGYHFASVVSPDADVSPSSELSEGVVIQAGVFITARASIGAFVRLNIGVKVFHDCQVGAFATIAPGATLLGCVKVGEDAYIGASSTVLPACVIGASSTVGAGAVVTHDVPDRQVVVGVPARRVKPV